MEELIQEIDKLCSMTSFRQDSILRIRTLYNKYINHNSVFCLQCPGSISQMIKTFQGHRQQMISKIVIEYEKLDEDDGDRI